MTENQAPNKNKNEQWLEGEAPDRTEIDLNEPPEEKINEPISTNNQWLEPQNKLPEVDLEVEKTPVKLSLLDLLYGILFSPVKTYRRVAELPPVGTTILLVLSLNLVLAIMGTFSTDTEFARMNPDLMGPRVRAAIETAAPAMAMIGFIFNVLIWFFYSALLHLIADFFGGKGRAVTTFTVYGLASLPALVLIPFNGLELISNSNIISTLSIIMSIAVLIWGIVLLTLGLREVHQFSTGRALAVVVTPWVAGFVILVLITILLIGFLSSLAPQIQQFSNF